jgi:GNAT superfamily N-acetyltransferase
VTCWYTIPMLTKIETFCENLTISTDINRLNQEVMYDMLTRAYWAQGRSREMIARTLNFSLVFGVYDGSKMIGMARVVSDYTTFAWLCDVFILEEYRGRGLSKWLLETVLAHPDLQGLRRFVLMSRDARGLYAKYGFDALATPEKWMEKFNG